MSKEIVLDCPKGSVRDLLDALAERFGSAARSTLFDRTGDLDRSCQVFMNDIHDVKRETLWRDSPERRRHRHLDDAHSGRLNYLGRRICEG